MWLLNPDETDECNELDESDESNKLDESYETDES